MLEVILGILGSGGFGSVLGLAGGYLNRRLDLQVKQLELTDKQAGRKFNLEYAQAEYAQRLQIADKELTGKQVDADAGVEVAGYGAMENSYSFAAPTAKDGWVDKFSKLVRPLLTLAFFGFSCVIFWEISKLVAQLPEPMPMDDAVKLWFLIIEWVLFQAGVCIGWWFAMRPGRVTRGG